MGFDHIYSFWMVLDGGGQDPPKSDPKNDPKKGQKPGFWGQKGSFLVIFGHFWSFLTFFSLLYNRSRLLFGFFWYFFYVFYVLKKSFCVHDFERFLLIFTHFGHFWSFLTRISGFDPKKGEKSRCLVDFSGFLGG